MVEPRLELGQASLGRRELRGGDSPGGLRLTGVETSELLPVRHRIALPDRDRLDPAGSLEAQIGIGGFYGSGRRKETRRVVAPAQEIPGCEPPDGDDRDENPNTLVHGEVSNASSIHVRSSVPWARASRTRESTASYRARAWPARA